MNYAIHRLVPSAVLIMFLASCGGGSSGTGAISAVNDGAVSMADTMTNYEKISTMQRNEGLTKAFAIAQFEAVFGSFGGGSGFVPDGSMPIYATSVVDDLLSFSSQLTTQQLEEAGALILPTVNNTRVLNSASQRVRQGGAEPELTQLAVEITAQIGAELGVELLKPVEVVSATRGDLYTDAELAANPRLLDLRQVYAYTISPKNIDKLLRIVTDDIADFGFVSRDSCWVVINENAQGRFRFRDFNPGQQRLGLTHEIAHCFETQISGDRAIPRWINEGLADWIAHTLVPGQADFSRVYWDEYEEPSFNLFASRYAAIGFWSYIDSFDPAKLWGRIPSIYQLPVAANEVTLSNIFGLSNVGEINNWSAFGSGEASWGDTHIWKSLGAGGHKVDKGTAYVVPGEEFSVDYGTANLYILDHEPLGLDGPYIFEVTTAGAGYMHWSNSGDTMAFSTNPLLRMCGSGGPCVCDDGMAPPGAENLLTVPGPEPLVVALTGISADKASTFSAKVTKIKDLCVPEPKPVTPSGRDSCLVGNWILDFADLRGQFMENLIALDPENRDIDLGRYVGTLSLTFNENGTAVGSADYSIIDDKDPMFVIIVKAIGGGSFNWSADGTEYEAENIDYAVKFSSTAIVGGAEFPLDGAGTDLGLNELLSGMDGQSSRYDCGERSLRFFN